MSYWRVDGCVESAEAPFFIDGTVLDLQSPLLLKKSTTIRGGAGAQVLSGRITTAMTPYRTTAAIAALPGMTQLTRRSSVADLTGVPAGEIMGQSFGSAQIPAQGHHFRTVGHYKEVQLQALHDGRVMMVKVRFWDQSGGVFAGIVYARDADVSQLGADFDKVVAREQPIAQTYQQAGYGCAMLVLDGIGKPTPLRFALSDDAVLTVSGDNAYTGTTVIESGTVRAGHVNAFSKGPVMVRNKGVLDKHGLVLPNEIINNGGTVLE
ncbi:hypothetical protein [Bordetella bronchiseptica]|uniref:hypothetical protein n=1 Tax=Bordetella bronchiseptica TaxID=518 RepID=UPI001F336637|nr:hypothetical protein [Bordetella bronchiseptica]